MVKSREVSSPFMFLYIRYLILQVEERRVWLHKGVYGVLLFKMKSFFHLFLVWLHISFIIFGSDCFFFYLCSVGRKKHLNIGRHILRKQ